MDVETLQWLLTPAGQRLLEDATGLADDSPAAQAALRRTTSAGRVAAALTQVDLRRRGAAKFGPLASRMYFTREGLEQATRLPVARHRAARVAAAGRTVLDLGCGIGGDLVAFAESGLTAAGVDLDPVRVALARANLDALGFGGAVFEADAAGVDTSPFDVAFADPARRTSRGRTFDPASYAPPWSFVEKLLARDACVKVAPGIPHALVPTRVEAEWVSDHGEVKEAALWAGRLATTRRRATVLGDGGLATMCDEDDPGAGTGAVAGFLYEPDGAVIRAGLVTAVAAGVGGHLLDEQIAYVASDSAFRTPFATAYRVVEELPYREKQLRAALRDRGVGRLTIKKRGVAVTPEALRARLSLRGDAEATIVLTRVAGRGTALLVEPM